MQQIKVSWSHWTTDNWCYAMINRKERKSVNSSWQFWKLVAVLLVHVGLISKQLAMLNGSVLLASYRALSWYPRVLFLGNPKAMTHWYKAPLYQAQDALPGVVIRNRRWCALKNTIISIHYKIIILSDLYWLWEGWRIEKNVLKSK